MCQADFGQNVPGTRVYDDDGTIGTVVEGESQKSTRRRILDFGCGTGWVLAKAGAPPTLCVGLDYSFDHLREGRRRYPGLRFVRGTGLALPFPEATFDEVIGHVSMPYINTRTAFREIYRVLAPGGSFFLTFHSLEYVRWRLRKDLHFRRWKDMVFMGYITANGLLNHCGMPQVSWLNGAFETIHTAGGVTKTARQIGFDSIRTEHQPGSIYFGATGRKPDPLARQTPPESAWSLSAVTQVKSE